VFALWFWLLQRDELTRLNAFTFLTPILALAIGVALYGERLALPEVAGIALTLLGVVLMGRA
ncbi:MAG TPA: EamA family transporter, partial [Chloroflexota bacterium]|nr:EamA family transporter [Chloroflexota bacterium]